MLIGACNSTLYPIHVVRHEVGHTLGLRHNFKGSSYIKLDQIQNTRFCSTCCPLLSLCIRCGRWSLCWVKQFSPVT